ncbi:hypothetical protein C8J56DRAFT_1103328 [Mycena floridula]|nr:hypothetical protein C8J56DRAFT_1103328 [Mycena floridula]
MLGSAKWKKKYSVPYWSDWIQHNTDNDYELDKHSDKEEIPLVASVILIWNWMLSEKEEKKKEGMKPDEEQRNLTRERRNWEPGYQGKFPDAKVTYEEFRVFVDFEAKAGLNPPIQLGRNWIRTFVRYQHRQSAGQRNTTIVPQQVFAVSTVEISDDNSESVPVEVAAAVPIPNTSHWDDSADSDDSLDVDADYQQFCRELQALQMVRQKAREQEVRDQEKVSQLMQIDLRMTGLAFRIEATWKLQGEPSGLEVWMDDQYQSIDVVEIPEGQVPETRRSSPAMFYQHSDFYRILRYAWKKAGRRIEGLACDDSVGLTYVKMRRWLITVANILEQTWQKYGQKSEIGVWIDRDKAELHAVEFPLPHNIQKLEAPQPLEQDDKIYQTVMFTWESTNGSVVKGFRFQEERGKDYGILNHWIVKDAELEPPSKASETEHNAPGPLIAPIIIEEAPIGPGVPVQPDRFFPIELPDLDHETHVKKLKWVAHQFKMIWNRQEMATNKVEVRVHEDPPNIKFKWPYSMLESPCNNEYIDAQDLLKSLVAQAFSFIAPVKVDKRETWTLEAGKVQLKEYWKNRNLEQDPGMIQVT